MCSQFPNAQKFVKCKIDVSSKDGKKDIALKAFRAFPTLLNCSINANIQKARLLWTYRQNYDFSSQNNRNTAAFTVTCNAKTDLHPVSMKAKSGRGKSSAAWLSSLHTNLRPKSDKLRRVGVEFSYVTIRLLSQQRHLLQQHCRSSYRKAAFNMVAIRRIQSFTEHFQIAAHEVWKFQDGP